MVEGFLFRECDAKKKENYNWPIISAARSLQPATASVLRSRILLGQVFENERKELPHHFIALHPITEEVTAVTFGKLPCRKRNGSPGSMIQWSWPVCIRPGALIFDLYYFPFYNDRPYCCKVIHILQGIFIQDQQVGIFAH